MPSSDLSPEEQRKLKPFDPVVLDRTVIAIPLLKKMQEDFDRIAEIEKNYPRIGRKFNAGIVFNPAFPGGPTAAHQEVSRLAKEAAQAALTTSQKRLKNARPDLREGAQSRHKALERAIARQEIGPLEIAGAFCFAYLHAAVIRRVEEASKHFIAAPKRNSSGEPVRPPLEHIYPQRFEIIIDLNLYYPAGREAARRKVVGLIERAKKEAGVDDPGQEVHFEKDRPDSQYVFARLEARAIRRLVEIDVEEAKKAATAKGKARAKTASNAYRTIFHIWPDFEVSACINKSIATVKADAAQNSFSASGLGITWAVMDSGIDRTHQHFQKYDNCDVTPEWHKDFTVDGAGPFEDENGHGTHVAGIIAGEWRVAPDAPKSQRRPVAVSRYLKTGTEDVEYQQTELDAVSGMAPRCKLVSLRVLDENGKGAVSNIIAAIDHVQEINGQGRRLLIHGVNLSLGYNFEPEWFACGQSPLCVEVDRLVKTGVVVVVAAGNTGYGMLKSTIGATSAGLALTINDPGNAELAITVGSTHRDSPHVYGVSYFSSKGPTGDGRVKPDLVAPGEKIISCATGTLKEEGSKGQKCDYVETSGTSMAAPHVSGVIAAFLSVRNEFIGKADQVKQIFLSTATDLRRDRYFQGAGLVDLMRAIQSV